jgi:hypothetical protein
MLHMLLSEEKLEGEEIKAATVNSGTMCRPALEADQVSQT